MYTVHEMLEANTHLRIQGNTKTYQVTNSAGRMFCSEWSLKLVEEWGFVLPTAGTYACHQRGQNLARIFRVAAPRTWNSLLLHLRSPTISRQQFQSGLKTHLFKCAYVYDFTSENYWGVNLLTYFYLLVTWMIASSDETLNPPLQ